MHPNGKSCTVGSTYEHIFDSPHPDPEKAVQEIMPQIIAFFPALKEAKVLRCRAGLRASSKNRLPIVGNISDKYYFFTGLGSKGLLYHGWVGKHVARAMLTQDKSHFPPEAYFPLEHLYPFQLKNWDFGGAKAPGLNDRK